VETDKGHYYFVACWRCLRSRNGYRDAEQRANIVRFECKHSNGSANKRRSRYRSGCEHSINSQGVRPRTKKPRHVRPGPPDLPAQLDEPAPTSLTVSAYRMRELTKESNAQPATMGASDPNTGRDGAIDFVSKAELLDRSREADESNVDDHIYRVIETRGYIGRRH
jgi:hypothetical protein